MKKIIFFTAFCTFLLKYHEAKARYNSIHSLANIDSFQKYYFFLDSIYKVDAYNNSEICKIAVMYMEKLTGIKAHSDGNFFGWYYFTGEDLKKWKHWYNTNSKKQLANRQLGIIFLTSFWFPFPCLYPSQ